MSGPLVLFVVTEDWYFVSHRLPLAESLRAAGYQVALASRFTAHRAAIEARGIGCFPIGLRRRASLQANLAAIVELRRLYRRLRPAIIHHVALKPVVFGSAALVGVGGVAQVDAIAGLGFLFTSATWWARVGRRMVLPALRALLGGRHTWIIVQNPEDQALLRRAGVGSPDRVRLIRGAGVDLEEYRPQPEPSGVPTVVLAGRMLRDKGVPEFVAAARRLRRSGVEARFRLVGSPDADNPTSVPRSELEAWHATGDVEWTGPTTDMPSVLAAAHIVCLPTVYGEGVPRILIEAAAAGRPIVATDWPGCREIVVDRRNGFLVAPGDPAALDVALGRLIADADLRTQFGRAGRELAADAFSIQCVATATEALYRDALRELQCASQ